MNLTEDMIDKRDAELDIVIAQARAEKDMLAAARRYFALVKQSGGTGAVSVVIHPAPPPMAAEQPRNNTAYPIEDNIPFFPGVRLTRNGKPTLSGQIVILLKESPEPWLTAREIRERVGGEPPMTSISPALSDLKDRDVIARKDLRVALKSRVEGEM